MHERPPNPDESAAARRAIRWDALAAIIASLVGLLALVVAGYTAYIQRQQVRAQVWPYLQMGKSNADGHYELVAVNKGVGPLIVRSVEVVAGGRPVSDWKELERLFGFKPTGTVVTSTLNRTVLAPGDKNNWIVFKDADDINAFVADWERFHVVASVCYTSTLGESWLAVFQPDGLTRPHAVPDCPRLPDSRQFSD